MKTSANKAAFSFATLAANISKGVISVDGAIVKAEHALNLAKQTCLEVLHKAVINAPSIDAKTFDDELKAPILAALKKCGQYAEASLPIKVSNIKVAIIGLTNGCEANEAEGLQAFVKRITPDIKAKGLYTPKAAGAKKKTAPKAKAGSVTSMVDSINFLADGDTDLVKAFEWVCASEANADKFKAWFAKVAK